MFLLNVTDDYGNTVRLRDIPTEAYIFCYEQFYENVTKFSFGFGSASFIPSLYILHIVDDFGNQIFPSTLPYSAYMFRYNYFKGYDNGY